MNRLFLPLMAAICVSGCATAIRGTHTDLVVATEPPGARVTTDLLNNQTRRDHIREITAQSGCRDAICRMEYVREQERAGVTFDVPDAYHSCEATPCEINVPRRSDFTLTVELDGYHPASIEITHGFGSGGSSAAGSAVGATGAYMTTYAALAVGEALVGGLATAAGGTAASSSAATVATGAAVVVGGGMILIDVASGAMLDLRPNPVILVLIPDDQPLPEGPLPVIETPEQLEAVRDQIGETN